MKHCPQCDRDLASDKFYRDSKQKDSKTVYCKECIDATQRVYVQKLKDKGIYQQRNRNHMRTFRKSARGRYWTLKYSARKRPTEFNIDIENFVNWYEHQPKICYYCGLPLNGQYHVYAMAETIDRKDNQVGYELGNIVLACRRCNTVKGNWFTADEMKEISQKYLTNRFGGVT